jgi:myo-inositol-1(or 4)-monophosphatase
MRWAHLAGEERAEAAAQAVVLGGRHVLERAGAADIRWKSDGSMVTDVDLAVEARLRAIIAQRFPDDAILTEEDAEERDATAATGFCWVLDPLDGTGNFTCGLPGYSVSLGILRDGLPFAGAVYDPVSDWLFTGCVGRGACLDGRALRTVPAPLNRRSLVSIRSPYDGPVPDFVQTWLTRYRLRRFGSTALQLCYVALGGLALVHDQRALAWDVAGAAPVLLEAGACLTRLDGSPLFPFSPEECGGRPLAFLAGNPEAHRDALGMLGDEMARDVGR